MDYARALTCLDEIVYNAIPIETHTDKKVGPRKENSDLKQVYVLVSVFRDRHSIIPVEMEVKTFQTVGAGLHRNVLLTKIDSEVLKVTPPEKAGQASSLLSTNSKKSNNNGSQTARPASSNALAGAQSGSTPIVDNIPNSAEKSNLKSADGRNRRIMYDITNIKQIDTMNKATDGDVPSTSNGRGSLVNGSSTNGISDPTAKSNLKKADGRASRASDSLESLRQENDALWQQKSAPGGAFSFQNDCRRPGIYRWYSNSRLYMLTMSPSWMPMPSSWSNRPEARSCLSKYMRLS